LILKQSEKEEELAKMTTGVCLFVIHCWEWVSVLLNQFSILYIVAAYDYFWLLLCLCFISVRFAHLVEMQEMKKLKDQLVVSEANLTNGTLFLLFIIHYSSLILFSQFFHSEFASQVQSAKRPRSWLIIIRIRWKKWRPVSQPKSNS
jgi:hypothetical protein